MFTKKTTVVEENFDVICGSVPLMVRIMEYAREDAKKDVDLHFVAEKMVKLCNSGKILSMKDYDEIVEMENHED